MTTLWALGLETKDTPVWADRLEINNVAYVSANRIIRLVLDLSPLANVRHLAIASATRHSILMKGM